MTKDQNSTFENLQEKIKDKLNKAKVEMEELSLQFTLGKAEAADKFEYLKKDFNTKVNEWKILGSQLVETGKVKSADLKVRFEELQIQLALGKAEAKELFQEQKKKIMQSISELEAEIKRK